ncbi:MAG: hypothetical protein ACI8W1_002942 [Candidatus Azotimanducaceae bacterium]|jgi:hypothetical protein
MAADNKPLLTRDEVKNISAPLDEAFSLPPNAYIMDSCRALRATPGSRQLHYR